MSALNYNPRRVWTIAQAKVRLSEVLRLAEEEGPQHIGTRRPFVVVPASDWYAQVRPMGQWLVDNMPRGANLDINSNRKSRREIPFTVGETE